jgi:hypothetical protein
MSRTLALVAGLCVAVGAMAVATAAPARFRALRGRGGDPFPVLKERLRAELTAEQWRALERDPVSFLDLRSRWVGEQREGFSSKGKARRRVIYLKDAKSREPYRLTIRKGRLMSGSHRFGTGQPNSHLVMDPSGHLFGRELFGTSEDGKYAHSSYAAGGPLRMSVEGKVKKGIVRQIKNRSGHYRPDRWLLDMEREGLDLSRTVVEFDRKSVIAPGLKASED